MNTFTKFKKAAQPLPRSIWQKPAHFIAFGFGTGVLPAPGTMGTLIAIPFYLVLAPLPPFLYCLLLAFLSIGAIILCDRVEKELNIHDHPGMSLDEIIGYLVTMIHVPPSALHIFMGFLFFRLFDIWKPWPIRRIDAQVRGGFGTVFDDILAGVYALLALQLFIYLLS